MLLEKEKNRIDPTSLVGGFSSQYDLVASEYGWTDEQIGDLSLVRFNQIAAAIRLRKFHETREENSRFSWLGRTLAQWIAAGYMSENNSKAVKQAGEIAYDDIEAAVQKEAQSFSSTKQESIPAENKNVNGSFEALLRLANQTRD